MKRILRIALVVLGVLGFTGFFAFSTFLFNPFEGNYAADVSTLLPRDIDLFVARADLAGEFDADLQFRNIDAYASGPLGRLVASDGLKELRSTYDEVRAKVKAELANLPIEAHPLRVFGGSDLAVAAYFDRGGEGRVEWAALGRGNWMAKLAFAALERPGWFGLEEQGFTTFPEGDVIRLEGGQLSEPLWFARVSDVIVVSNARSLAAGAREFERTRAENSFGMSARYNDQILARAAEKDVEVFVRSSQLPEMLGAEGPLPDPQSVNFLEALAGRMVSLGSISEFAGSIGLGAELQTLRAEGKWDAELLTSDQKRIYRHRTVDQRDVVRDLARITPADSGLVYFLEADLGDLLRLAVQSAERALIDNLESEVLQPIFGYAQVDTLIAELEAAFRDRIAIIVRPNVYSERGSEDPPNDGRPAVAIAIVLWIENSDYLYNPDTSKAGLLNRLQDPRNAPRLGLQGKNGEPGIYINDDRGWKLTEYWSPLVPGTGHISTGVYQDLFVITNHWRMPGEIFRASLGTREVPSLADRADFTAMMNTGLTSVTSMLWLDPGRIETELRGFAHAAARDDVVAGIDWSIERPRIEKRVLKERFPNEVWGKVSPEVEMQVEEYVLDAIDDFRAAYSAEHLPALIAATDARIDTFVSVARALIQVKLDSKNFQLDARLVPRGR